MNEAEFKNLSDGDIVQPIIIRSFPMQNAIPKPEIEFEHKWSFDWPWEMVDLKDWFYMVNQGEIFPVFFMYVRIFGICSRWTVAPKVKGELQKWVNNLTE